MPGCRSSGDKVHLSIACSTPPFSARFLEVPKLSGILRFDAELEAKVRRRESLVLPMSGILETGNHVGQVGDGRQRREVAKKFILLIQQAIRGEAPFTPTPFFEPDDLLAWLDEFPDWAARGSGFADLSSRSSAG